MVHALAPEAENVVAGQEAEKPVVPSQKLPAAHVTQLELPGSIPKVVARQVVQVVDPAAENLPEGHGNALLEVDLHSEPAGHTVQVVAPPQEPYGSTVYVPTLQSEQTEAAAPENLPRGQRADVPASVDDVATPAHELPAGHVSQRVLPIVSAQVVALQVVQADAPAAEYLPTGHQLERPVEPSQKLPAMHVTQLVLLLLPGSLPKVVAGHVVQAVAPAREYEPAPHVTGAELGAGHAEPAGQTVHDDAPAGALKEPGEKE